MSYKLIDLMLVPRLVLAGLSKNDNLTLKDRFWTCLSCGTTHDRDILAAKNIKRSALMRTLGGEGSLSSINKACGAINVSWSYEAGTSCL
jgi:transposase